MGDGIAADTLNSCIDNHKNDGKLIESEGDTKLWIIKK